MRIDIPDNVSKIIEILYEHGYEAFAVGGCVRDSYLGKKPKDWDITTSAQPLIIKELFKRTIDTGIEHGTVTVMIGSEGYEVTTYRIDGEYEDNRHPKEVRFTSNLVEDLKRRDFTINAMAYNNRAGLIDCFNGKGDLDNRIIRCVGEANERFSEDALRILRAIRFSAQLDFSIEDSTIEAIKVKAVNLQSISAERIKTEFDKLLMSGNANRIIDAYHYGVTRYVMPEFDVMMETKQENPNHIYNVGEHTIKAVNYLDEAIKEYSDAVIIDDKTKLMLKWTMLLHDVAKPIVKTYDDGVAHFKMHEVFGIDIAKEIFARLKFDRYTHDNAIRLIKFHDYRFTNKPITVRRAASKIGVDIMEYLFMVKMSDILAQNPNTIDEKLKDLKETKRIYDDIKLQNECLQIKDLDISGRDLINFGIKPGPQIGEILDKILECVIEKPEINNKLILIELVKDIYK